MSPYLFFYNKITDLQFLVKIYLTQGKINWEAGCKCKYDIKYREVRENAYTLRPKWPTWEEAQGPGKRPSRAVILEIHILCQSQWLSELSLTLLICPNVIFSPPPISRPEKGLSQVTQRKSEERGGWWTDKGHDVVLFLMYVVGCILSP